jgi:integrase
MRRDNDGVYTRKDRDGFWTHWPNAQGLRKWRKLKGAQTLTQARQARAALILAAERSRVLGFAAPGDDTFAQVADRYLKHQRPPVLTLASYERTKGILKKHLKPFFPGAIAAIRRVDVNRYLTKRGGEAKSDTVIKELNVLKHMLNLAVEWEVVPTNAAKGVKPPKAAEGRVRYLQPAEFVRLMEFAPPWLRPIVALAITTGMRRSEILGLRWAAVDLKNARLWLRKTKNGGSRVVYLNLLGVAVVDSLSTNTLQPSDQLFREVTPHQVSVAFRRLCLKLKILDFRFHDLRHTAASHLRMKHRDTDTVAKILGHKDLRMAQRYQHLSSEFLAEAMDGLNDVFPASCYQSVTNPKLLPS